MKHITLVKILLFITVTTFHSMVTCTEFSEDFSELFRDKTILITGGTGFIGQALIQEILPFGPKKIIILSRDEVKHHIIQQKYAQHATVFKHVIGDVRNYDTILHATRNVDIVIHAAALKRIDMLEYHIVEAISTNTIGSLNIARACIENNVPTALLVSTDKACAPVNAYGACKFLAEKIFTNFAIQQHSATRFIAVRYGNVLNSTGSAIPFFCNKINNGDSIPLTDERMTRFFLSQEQAVELIFNALKYAQAGEIFIPRIASFKIVDLIDALQTLLDKKVSTHIIGLRPGEKIHEIMLNEAEISRVYRFKDIFVLTPSIQLETEHASAYRSSFLSTQDFLEYSSADTLLSINELIALLQRYNVL